MEGKRLDLDAPLMSFRRITPPTSLRREAVPFFNSDPTPAMVGNPGTVPFVWEKSPGQPKDSSVAAVTVVFLNPAAPKLPPGRSLKENGADWLKGASTPAKSEMVLRTPSPITYSPEDRNEKEHVADEDEAYFTEEEAFADAQDGFSCAESFSMKCSTSAGTGFRDHSKRLAKDPQIKDFVMDRFLPAAQAMATGSHQRAWRKPPRAPVLYIENSGDQIVKSRLPLDYYYQLGRDQKKEDAEEEDNGDETYGGSHIFSSNGCGLIHRLFLKKNPFDLLNPSPGKKLRGKPMPRIHSRPQIKVLQDASLCQIKDENSWEAVYVHKLNLGYHPHKEEDRKLSESNQLTSWGDSQMLDGSSFLNSSMSTLSADKREDSKRESGSWKDWETRYSHERLQETPDCKSSEGESQKREESVVCETCAGHELQSSSSKIDDELDKNDDSDDGLASKVEKNDGSLTLSLPPPPLPTSPSESWLRRTLPSMSSKSPHPHHPSLLGMQLHHKKQVSWASACDHRPITYERPSNSHLP
ncbi:hypothetical protein KSP39_PZI020518 [Platanthera zijinensis]|uniref:Uncharacterized protein n=1 Tax=Platanthera zijinensis TaxID=2320716 RepID=A0AAP0FX09_9ASPA